MLAFGKLDGADYNDDSEAASSQLVEHIRRSTSCVVDPQFTADYHDPTRRTISNALTVTLMDGTMMDEVVVQAPLGHRFRREEAIPKIMDKYERHLASHYRPDHVKRLMELGSNRIELEKMDMDSFVDLYVEPYLEERA